MSKNLTNGVKYTERELMLALYDIQDILERAQCPYLILKDTARALVDGRRLFGEGIYIGVQKKYLNRYALSTINFYLSGLRVKRQTEVREDGFDYVWNNVPIYVKFIDRNYEFFKHPDFVWYNATQYSIPNPFEKYWKARFIIK